MEYIFTASGLSKHYGSFKALDNLTMHVPKGAIYGLVGRNGAGKTTLIRLLCGLQSPTAGSFRLYGAKWDSRAITVARRRMGAVVETPAIHQNLSATDNLKVQYTCLGLPTFEGIPELLALVGLEDARTKKVRNFSLGMKQRLGIAIALASGPDLLVLDEPINGLDPQGIIEIRELILKLNREHQITILLSSHILDELSKLATYYGFLDHGRLVKEMSAEELESTCRKCLRIEVTDTKSLARALDAMAVEYTILSPTQADIYAHPNITRLADALAEQNCEILALREQDESLESYFLSLVGGEYHD